VASFCGEFLPKEMHHVYRQVAGLKEHRSLVITRRRNHEAAFPFPNEDIVLTGKPPLRGVRRVWHRQILGHPVPSWTGEVEQILRTLEEREACLLHIYLGDVAASLLPLIRRCRVPVLVSFHGSDAAVEGSCRAGFRKATTAVLEAADFVVARSDSLREQLLAFGSDPSKIGIQRTGVPLSEWPFSERRTPANGRWRLLQIGRLVSKKGLATTIAAFAEIVRIHPQAELAICGQGAMEEELRALAARLGVADQVEFLGFLGTDRLREEMDHAHLYLHPSETTSRGDREGVPNSMLEAMAMGLPTCATRHGGIPEAIEDGVSGLLVEERDAPALAKAALGLLASEDQRRAMAEAGRARVERLFDSAEQVSALEQLYRRLAQEFPQG